MLQTPGRRTESVKALFFYQKSIMRTGRVIPFITSFFLQTRYPASCVCVAISDALWREAGYVYSVLGVFLCIQVAVGSPLCSF